MFVQQKRKHGEVVFLMFMSVSKHILFALGVDPTARDAGEGGGFRPNLASYTSLVSSSLARHQANAVEFATKVCFSLFHGSEVIA